MPEYPIEKSSDREITKVKTEIIPQRERIKEPQQNNETVKLIGKFIKGFILGSLEAITDIDLRNKKTPKTSNRQNRKRKRQKNR